MFIFTITIVLAVLFCIKHSRRRKSYAVSVTSPFSDGNYNRFNFVGNRCYSMIQHSLIVNKN